MRCAEEIGFFGASDEDSDGDDSAGDDSAGDNSAGDNSVSADSDASEDVDKVNIKVTSPRGAMTAHTLERNSEGMLEHVFCPRLDASKGTGRPGKDGDEGVGDGVG